MINDNQLTTIIELRKQGISYQQIRKKLSLKCSATYLTAHCRKLGIKKHRDCLVCGSNFEVLHSNQVCCSDDCQDKRTKNKLIESNKREREKYTKSKNFKPRKITLEEPSWLGRKHICNIDKLNNSQATGIKRELRNLGIGKIEPFTKRRIDGKKTTYKTAVAASLKEVAKVVKNKIRMYEEKVTTTSLFSAMYFVNIYNVMNRDK